MSSPSSDRAIMNDIFQHQCYGQPAAHGIAGEQGQDEKIRHALIGPALKGIRACWAKGSIGPSTEVVGGELEARQKIKY